MRYDKDTICSGKEAGGRGRKSCISHAHTAHTHTKVHIKKLQHFFMCVFRLRNSFGQGTGVLLSYYFFGQGAQNSGTTGRETYKAFPSVSSTSTRKRLQIPASARAFVKFIHQIPTSSHPYRTAASRPNYRQNASMLASPPPPPPRVVFLATFVHSSVPAQQGVVHLSNGPLILPGTNKA